MKRRLLVKFVDDEKLTLDVNYSPKHLIDSTIVDAIQHNTPCITIEGVNEFLTIPLDRLAYIYVSELKEKETMEDDNDAENHA